MLVAQKTDLSFICFVLQVFKMFAMEIQETRKELVEDKRQHPMGLPRYSGRALMAMLKKKRLQTLMRVRK